MLNTAPASRNDQACSRRVKRSRDRRAGPPTDRRPNSSRGIALVAVLWVTSLLAAMAAGLMSTTRTDVKLASNAIENTKARILADGGIHRALFDLLALPAVTGWRANFAYDHILDDGRVRLSISDEDGKIDLNDASLPLLAGLLRTVGLDEERSAILADRIGDYRDDDAEPEPLGAEDHAYLAAGLDHGAADQPFRTEDELADVLGMTENLVDRLRSFVTVYSGADGVDPLRASQIALKAIPGMTDEAVTAIIDSPPEFDPLLDLPIEVLNVAQGYFVPSRNLVFSIEAQAASSGGGRFSRLAIVALDAGQGNRPFRILAWRDDLATNARRR